MAYTGAKATSVRKKRRGIIIMLLYPPHKIAVELLEREAQYIEGCLLDLHIGCHGGDPAIARILSKAFGYVADHSVALWIDVRPHIKRRGFKITHGGPIGQGAIFGPP